MFRQQLTDILQLFSDETWWQVDFYSSPKSAIQHLVSVIHLGHANLFRHLSPNLPLVLITEAHNLSVQTNNLLWKVPAVAVFHLQENTGLDSSLAIRLFCSQISSKKEINFSST